MNIATITVLKPPAIAIEHAFTDALHVGRPNIGDRERFLERVNQMLDRRWLSNHGPLVQEFEQRLAEYLGVKNCICVCNATVGLEIAIRAIGLHGEVIVPSYTFVATAHALQWQEITPVFCDVDPETHNIDPDEIERHITPKTTGILATHVWGRPCAIEKLTQIARRRNLSLMFDAAHAFGCSNKGRMIGGNGVAEVFSFHATKFLNSFEGGAITTNNDALAARIRLMTNFGFSGYDNVVHIGTNGKMTEICAAMGLTNLESVADLIAVNKRNYDLYAKLLEPLRGIKLIEYNSKEKTNYQYIVVEIDEEIARVNRDDLIMALHAHNVLARKYFWPGCHRMEPYRSLQPNAYLLLPMTEQVAARTIVLPTGQTVTPEAINSISAIIRHALNQSA